jgi:hypothetical protein
MRQSQAKRSSRRQIGQQESKKKSWKERRAIRGKFQGEDDLEELPHIYIYEYQLSETRSSYWNYFPVMYCKDIQD